MGAKETQGKNSGVNEKAEDLGLLRNKEELKEKLLKNKTDLGALAEKVQSLTRTFTHCNILTVKAGTNTPQGGDAGHRGVTVFELVDEGGTTWKVWVVDESGREWKFSSFIDLNDEKRSNGLKRVRVELFGDAEAETFLKALDFAVKTLKLQRGEL